MIRNLNIFLQFLLRDFYSYQKSLQRLILNYCVLTPIMFSISFAYIQANVTFCAQQKTFVTIFLAGNAMLLILGLTSKFAFRLLFDLEQNHFINYQTTILHPRLVILERIVFFTLFSFVLTLPFFPVAKLLLLSTFVTTKTSWVLTIVMLALGSLFYTSFHVMIACILKNSQNLSSFFLRINIPLMLLGGFWVPLHIIRQAAPTLSYLVLLNPVIYLTEGLRAAILGTPQFLPVRICAPALLCFSIVFTLATFYFFKKKTDHI